MIFGTGIVKLGDFGIQGDFAHGHPEAIRLACCGVLWKVLGLEKSLSFFGMVMSALKAISFANQEQITEADQDNKYFQDSSSYRLPARIFIRDNALASSGYFGIKKWGPV